MSNTTNAVRMSRMRITLMGVGWSSSSKGTDVMCGWIADEFLHVCIRDLERCVQLPSHDRDPVSLIKDIWEIACHRKPELLRNGRTPEQELIHREFKCEKMDASDRGKGIMKKVTHRELPKEKHVPIALDYDAWMGSMVRELARKHGEEEEKRKRVGLKPKEKPKRKRVDLKPKEKPKYDKATKIAHDNIAKRSAERVRRGFNKAFGFNKKP